MDNPVQVFSNERFRVHCYIDATGTAWFDIENVARSLGFVMKRKERVTTNGDNYTAIRWKRVNKYIAEIKERATSELIQAISVPVDKKGYIPENLVYRLAMKANNELAEKFQAWIADVVIPSIRKTGSYTLPTANPQDDPRWIETRAHGKATRRKETDLIKIFNEYRKAQGSKRPDAAIYALLSNLANKAAGVKKGGRDSATVHQLTIIDLAEGMIHDELAKGINADSKYVQILNTIKDEAKVLID